MEVYNFDPDTAPIEIEKYEQLELAEEKTLESWIHAHPHVLLDESLLIVGRQTSVDSGSPDLVACDSYGNLVIIEVKIGKSGTKSASEETILGQPQAYAGDYSTHSYDDLNEMYRNYKRRLADGKWSPLGVEIAPGESLVEAVNGFFDLELAESQINTYQRRAVVAEEVTDSTARHYRNIKRQGVPVSCVELRWYQDAETGDSILAQNVVVDHDRRSVKPDTLGPRTYPNVVKNIVESVFDDLGPILNADHPLVVLSDGYDVRTPRLSSNQSWHPDGLVYRLGVKPDRGHVTIAIDNPTGTENSTQRVLEAVATFRAEDFEVNEGASQWSLVKESWKADSVADIEDLRDEIGNRFLKMVELANGHFQHH